MENFKRLVCVSDTDCTKALYFTSQLKFVQESFEKYLIMNFPSLITSFNEGEIAFPIVHTEASFVSPIFAGMEIDIDLDVEFKNTSFVVRGILSFEGHKKGEVSITHVCRDLMSQRNIKAEEVFSERV